ncbi:uncharacterized protein L969DRAFT_96445 [Mixia osmundae IAM 14324]|nr:uncharacterized protein L969DRAFT_96445 [Mixia osmundae IAM 14324]KEI37366.1 hypothetical protein L969DRAFT_96445 [Mixia osmundae IAM 14324]
MAKQHVPFSFPAGPALTVFVPGALALAGLYLAQPGTTLGNIKEAIGGQSTVVGIFLLLNLAHVFEAILMFVKCSRAGVSTADTRKWCAAVLIFGFPVGQKFDAMVKRVK